MGRVDQLKPQRCGISPFWGCTLSTAQKICCLGFVSLNVDCQIGHAQMYTVQEHLNVFSSFNNFKWSTCIRRNSIFGPQKILVLRNLFFFILQFFFLTKEPFRHGSVYFPNRSRGVSSVWLLAELWLWFHHWFLKRNPKFPSSEFPPFLSSLHSDTQLSLSLLLLLVSFSLCI